VAAILSNPDRPLFALQDRLARGETVTLVSDKGSPLWSAWALKSASFNSLSPDGYFSLSSNTLGLLELARDLPVERYRLKAKVRQDGGDSLGNVGLFVGLRSSPGLPAANGVCYTVTFNDVFDLQTQFPTIPGNAFHLTHAGFIDVDNGEPFFHKPLWAKPAWFKATGLGFSTWRTVTVDVRPERVEASFNGVSVGPLRHEEQTTRLAKELDELPNRTAATADLARLQLTPRGSLGILAYHGSASFADVVVEPLPDN
jgi:hypothetical protein